jgi:Tfp pilus assembly protein PilV
MEIKRGERGMTLLEVMIAMGVSMAMLAAGTALYINGIKQSVANQAQAMGSSQAQKLATTIENDIQQAVLIPTDPAHPTITVYTGKPYAPDATTLVLKLPAYKCVDNVGNTITCDASNANLNVRTLLSTYDYVVYQFVQFETVGGVQHKTYNIWKIVSADPASSRQNSSGWVFPYSASFDATDPNQFRSDPYVQTWDDAGTPTIF